MDNVTHSLAGLLIGEAAGQLRRARTGDPPSAGFGTTAALAGVVAANLPDADVFYAALALDKLGSLLHHRGYTHTLLAAVAGAFLTWAAALAIWRWRARRAPDPSARPGGTPGERRWLLAVCVVAVLSHLALDFTNSYGVHPFSPVRDTWHYGDAVFIIEPWLWVAAVPPLLFAARRRAVRVGLGLVLAAGLALAWFVPLVAWGAALALTAGGVASLWAAARLRPGARAAVGVAGWLLVELVFAAGGRAARAQVVAAASANVARDVEGRGGEAARRLVDVVITPAPANPLCASAIVVETAGSRYRVTTASAAALPSVVPARHCQRPTAARGGGDAGNLVMRPAARPSTGAVAWERAWDAPLAELVALDREHCQAAALLRFARVPFWFRVDATTLHVGDLRYDRDTSVGFAEFRVPSRPASCPRSVPPWRPPLHAVLGRS